MKILLLPALVVIALPRDTATLTILPEFVTSKTIKILSDFTSEGDKKFFKTTFPWLVYNFPNLEVEYYFKDGEVGGKRMCVLDSTKNLAWQADFLQCQAQGGHDCKEEQFVQKRAYDRCTQTVYFKMRDAADEFKRYKPLYTPLIVSGWSKLTAQDPMDVLNHICKGFSWTKPESCKHPSSVPDLEDKGKNPDNESDAKDTDDLKKSSVQTDSDAKAGADNGEAKKSDTKS